MGAFAMTDAGLPFSEWREQLEEDLAEAREAFATASVDLQAAKVSHDAARGQHEAARAAVGVLRQPIAQALAARLRHFDEGVHDAAAAVARARGALSGASDRVADLEQALREIAQLMAPAAEEEEAADAT
jgi:chromosome segregation ATPase